VVSVKISRSGRRSAATLSAWFGGGRNYAATPLDRWWRRLGGAHVVAVGQELLPAASVLDPDDPRLGELAHGPVNGVDRAAQSPCEGGPGRHTAA